MKPKLFKFWSTVAYQVAALSSCDRLRVGALVLSLDGERLLSFGYNGGVRGGANAPEEDVPGCDFWLHAEMNALVKPRPMEPFVVLVTHTPCFNCARYIINAQPHAVYALNEYRDTKGWELLQQTLGAWDKTVKVDHDVIVHCASGAHLVEGV